MYWRKWGKTVSSEGTTITYICLGTTLTIESRKRAIPHANGIGTWDLTTYFVLDRDKVIREFSRLADAKEWAEKAFERGELGHL